MSQTSWDYTMVDGVLTVQCQMPMMRITSEAPGPSEMESGPSWVVVGKDAVRETQSSRCFPSSYLVVRNIVWKAWVLGGMISKVNDDTGYWFGWGRMVL